MGIGRREAEHGQIRELIREAEKALDECERSKHVPFASLVLTKALVCAAERARVLESVYLTEFRERVEDGGE
jgi:hypothetical protein